MCFVVCLAVVCPRRLLIAPPASNSINKLFFLGFISFCLSDFRGNFFSVLCVMFHLVCLVAVRNYIHSLLCAHTQNEKKTEHRTAHIQTKYAINHVVIQWTITALNMNTYKYLSTTKMMNFFQSFQYLFICFYFLLLKLLLLLLFLSFLIVVLLSFIYSCWALSQMVITD